MRGAAVLALLLTLALPGCALFTGPAATIPTPGASTPTAITTVGTTSTPAVDPIHLAQPSLRDLVLLPLEFPLGEATAARVTVVNPTANDLTARVELLLDGSPVITVTSVVAPNATLETGGRIQPATAGTHTAGARLANSTQPPLTATIRALGPRFANVTVTPAAEQGCNKVTFTVNFTNVGEGPARDVTVVARLLDANHALVAAPSKTIATINAGQKGALPFTIDAAARCPTTSTYSVGVTITSRTSETVEYTSAPFQA